MVRTRLIRWIFGEVVCVMTVKTAEPQYTFCGRPLDRHHVETRRMKDADLTHATCLICVGHGEPFL